jgi:hydroxymethylglutaryl-CoA synthase
VFEGVIQAGWQAQIEKSALFTVLANSQEIDFDTYEKLHKKELKTAVRVPKHEWVLDRIEAEIPNLIGARYYKWID